MIKFQDYARIKNNYCLCYFGQCNEYLILLELLRHRIEEQFPGMNFYISCKDEVKDVFTTNEKIFSISELRLHKNNFAHIKELKYEDGKHPIRNILETSDVTNFLLRSNFEESNTTKAVIVTHNTYPTNPMTQKQIDLAKNIALSRGFEPEVSEDWSNSGLVIGVESTSLIRAAYSGIPSVLVDNGVGGDFYKMMFPTIELLPK